MPSLHNSSQFSNIRPTGGKRQIPQVSDGAPATMAPLQCHRKNRHRYPASHRKLARRCQRRNSSYSQPKSLKKESTAPIIATRSGSTPAVGPNDVDVSPYERKSPFLLPVMGRTAALPNFPVSSFSARPARAQLPAIGRPCVIARLPAVGTARNRRPPYAWARNGLLRQGNS
jgi:hypothetical protein